jgi:hypothetical protein
LRVVRVLGGVYRVDLAATLPTPPPGDVFNLLMEEMRKVYNPPEEKKKTSWWGSWLGGGK